MEAANVLQSDPCPDFLPEETQTQFQVTPFHLIISAILLAGWVLAGSLLLG